MTVKISYRPEIDGLRGIAVLLVVFYHFEKIFFSSSIFQGGYIGVDIFFVISGYLISSIVFKELRQKRNFSFSSFYIRRIKRILPVLLLVISFCIFFSSFLFIPEKYDFTIKSAISSWFFFSNIFFWKKSTIYNSEESSNIPLLHTWSLSVEEQFYIIFPLFLFFIFKFYINRILILINFFLIFSLILALFSSLYFPNGNFYLLPTRVWEILSGTIIAYYEIFKNKKKQLNNFSKFLILISFIIILVFVVFANKRIYHPSLITILPVFSSVCLIFFCRDKFFFINKILSSKYLVYFGVISYSLYLWHYPLFVFLKNLNLQSEYLNYIKYLTLIISFIIAIATYILIEKPLRRKSYNLNYLLFPLFFFSFVIIFLDVKESSKLNFSTHMSKVLKEQIILTKKDINCFENFGIDKFCYLSKISKINQKNVILLGDSVAFQLANNLNDNLSTKNFRVVNLASGGNFYIPYGKFINEKNGFSKFDEAQNKEREAFFKKYKKNIIIFGAQYREYLNNSSFIYINDLEKNINPLQLLYSKDMLIKKGLEDIKIDFSVALHNLLQDNLVILIYPFPEYSEHVIQSSYVKFFLKKNFKLSNKDLDIKYDDFILENYNIIDFLDTLNHKNLYKIYPQNLFCNQDLKKCFFTKNEIPLYYDKIHLTYAGIKILNDEIINLINVIKDKI
jgi:peptidoglycan/LPS O-acetylase OafA/YrhL